MELTVTCLPSRCSREGERAVKRTVQIPCRNVRLRPASDGRVDSGTGYGETAFAYGGLASLVRDLPA
jgi:hypothetical protein